MVFSGDETTDIGVDSATPVSDDHGPKDSRFKGASTGSKSPSATTPKTPTTSSQPNNDSESQ